MSEQLTFGLPKPKKVLITAMVVVSALWIFFATGINWAGGGVDVFSLLTGSDQILKGGEVWRLLTSFMVHQPSGPGSVGHLLTTLMGLYFLGSSLEDSWGPRRFGVFLLISGVFASLLQVVVGLLISNLHQATFYGGLGVIDAIAVAWGLSFKDRQLRLFFVLPVSGMGFIAFVLVMNVLYILANEVRREGLVSPFGGMLAGYLLADGSPLRRFYLQWKFRRLQSQSESLRGIRAAIVREKKPNPAGLRVIKGGKSDKDLLN
jgi:membrane associated rhomboid family serine protease